MSSFTYQKDNASSALETFEWDNTWIDHANDNRSHRVLYIGDSISCATRRIATERSEQNILFDGFGTSKSLDNPFFIDSIKLFAQQEGYRNAVIFNNGLHGWHLDDNGMYSLYYSKILKGIKELFKSTPIFSVLTTYVSDKERNERVILRNLQAEKNAKELGISVIDLYSVSEANKHLISSDGVHYTKEGYEKFADKILSDIKIIL